MRTRVGYAGGTKKNPTYHDLGDHTETTEIDFDPLRVTYAELLEIFWRTHNPCARPYSRQYMSAIFTHSEEQKSLALQTLAREEARRGSPILTAILPYTGFTLAEDYHQKYYLQQYDALVRDFRRVYPEFRDFVNSTAAARVNGFLDGNAGLERLKAELDGLGLSEEGRRELLGRVR